MRQWGPKNENIQEEMELTDNPDTAGDVLSEISDFPAVALSSINP